MIVITRVIGIKKVVSTSPGCDNVYSGGHDLWSNCLIIKKNRGELDRQVWRKTWPEKNSSGCLLICSFNYYDTSIREDWNQ